MKILEMIVPGRAFLSNTQANRRVASSHAAPECSELPAFALKCSHFVGEKTEEEQAWSYSHSSMECDT